MSIMPKEDWDAIPTITKLKIKHPLLLHRVLSNNLTMCLGCRYILDERDFLDNGYKCPECGSPFVIKIEKKKKRELSINYPFVVKIEEDK